MYSKAQVARPEYSISNTYTNSHSVIRQCYVSTMMVSRMMVADMKVRKDMGTESVPSGTDIVKGSYPEVNPVAFSLHSICASWPPPFRLLRLLRLSDSGWTTKSQCCNS